MLCVLVGGPGARVENVTEIARGHITVALTTLPILLVIEKVDRGEEHVFAVFEVQPGLVLARLNFKNRKRRALIGHCERFWLHQSFNNFLSSVPVVYVEINDCDPLDLTAVLAQSVRSCQRHVIDEAETIGACFPLVFRVVCLSKDSSMVPRRSCRTERVSVVLGHYLVDSFDGSTSRDQSCFPSFLRCHRVLPIEVLNALVAGASQLGNVLHHLLDVVEVVDFEKVCDFGPFVHMLLDIH